MLNGFHLQKNQSKGLLPEGFDINKTNIAIFNTTIYEFSSVEDSENKIYQDEIDAFTKIVESFKGLNYKFYLRIHPNLKGALNSQIKDLQELDSKKYENLKIIWPEENIDTYSLMMACEKIVVLSSSMGVESCFWGKSSILAGGRARYENLDCCYKPKTHEELVDLLKKDLKPKNQIEAIKYGCWMMSYGLEYIRYKPITHIYGTYMGKSMEVNSSFNEIVLKILKNVLELLNNLRIKFLSLVKKIPVISFFYFKIKKIKDSIKKIFQNR